MADISTYLFVRHLRSEPGFHVLRFRAGKLVASGRGLTFFFHPISTSVAEIPVDDRQLPFLFHGRSSDFQDITVQGTIDFRVVEPETLGARVDFSIDLARGTYSKEPLDQLASLMTGHAQQIAARYLAGHDVRSLTTSSLAAIQEHLESGLRAIASLQEMGVAVNAVQVSSVSPTAELEKALQTPTRESLQQEADRATFERRAIAVENERAIAENELQNRIALARREQSLIEQQGDNERRRAQDEVDARAIEVGGRAQATRIEGEAEADRIKQVGGARAETEAARLDAYRTLPTATLMALAAKELAGKLKQIDHLNLSPDFLSTHLASLLAAGTERLAEK